MRILLAIGIQTPIIAKKLGIKSKPLGGWLIDFINRIGSDKDYDLVVCFPSNSKISFIDHNISYESYPYITENNYKSQKRNNAICNLINDISPDIVHVYGLEYPFANTFVHQSKAYKTLGTIQGIISKCAIHYDNQIPSNVTKKKSIGDILLKQGSINHQKKHFYKLGEIEIDTYKNLDYIIGRTLWDKETSLLINQNLKYFHCNEILRPELQKNKKRWDMNKCVKKRIFVTQASYALKGLHQLIKACGLLVNEFPELEIIVGGADVISRKKIKNKLKASSYSNYLIKLIKKNGLENNLKMIGFLDAEEVVNNLLLANVFICPSSIENSSNSIAEAMVIGTPIIASKVGGNEDFIEHNFNGLTYPYDEYYILTSQIKKIFTDVDLCNMFKENSLSKSYLFDAETNIKRMKEIYLEIEGDKCV